MRKRLIRRKKYKKQKKIILVSTFCLLVIMGIGYAAFQTNLKIIAKGNIKEKSRVIQSWSSTDQTDFHSDFYKENIVSAIFVDNNNVPNNATESWNVSEDKENGLVMAWVVSNKEDSTKYDLYIGAKGGVIANENSSYLFNYFTEIKELNFNDNFDTSNVTNMNYMFQNCQSLTHLDLKNFNTDAAVTMRAIFARCSKLTELNLNNFNTSNVTNMRDMFYGCSSLTVLDVSNFNTSNVTNMIGMFGNCSSLIELNLSTFNTSNVTEMWNMFIYCNSLEKLNLCSFDTSNTTGMWLMFMGTTNMKVIYVGPKWTIEKAEALNQTYDMFTYSGVSSVTTGQC